MKKIKQFLFLLSVTMLMVSCKKYEPLPQSTIGNPVFYFKGMIDGVSTSYYAGYINYYMYSSYTQDSNHVYNFIGDLKETNSNLNSIQIQINDYKVSAVNSNTQPDSSFGFVNYPYYSVGVTDTAYNVQFSASYSNGTAQTYTWSFGDGTTTVGTSTLQSHTYAQSGTYNVCLNATGSAGNSSICNNINITSSAAPVKKVIISSTSSGNTVNFIDSTTFIPQTHIWHFGDGIDSVINSSFQINTVTHAYTTPGLYQVSLTVVYNGGLDSIATNYNVTTASYTVAAVNFAVNNITQVVTTGSNLRLANVIVNWTDANGVVYTSDNSLQPATSSFKILSEEAYQNNINGQPTRKLHVNFTCTLYSAGHSPIQITNADAVIAVAYK